LQEECFCRFFRVAKAGKLGLAKLSWCRAAAQLSVLAKLGHLDLPLSSFCPDMIMNKKMSLARLVLVFF
jgi:hypothetical protein